MAATFEVGAKVRYSAKFLRSTGQYTGDIPFARGVITALRPMGDATIATVDFKASLGRDMNVLTANLEVCR